MNNTRIKEILNEAGYPDNNLRMMNLLSKVWQETVQEAYTCEGCTADGSECITCSRNYEDKFTAKEKEWYEDDTNFPLLCYVWDTEENHKDVIRIVTEFESNHFCSQNGLVYWKHATPLTKEQVLDFCLNP